MMSDDVAWSARLYDDWEVVAIVHDDLDGLGLVEIKAATLNTEAARAYARLIIQLADMIDAREASDDES